MNKTLEPSCEGLGYAPGRCGKHCLDRLVTGSSIVSTRTTLETPCNSVQTRSHGTNKSQKFRPRFADEGLEDLHSDPGDDLETRSTDDLDDSEDVEKFRSNDLEECIQVGAEMEMDILSKGAPREVIFAPRDLLID